MSWFPSVPILTRCWRQLGHLVTVTHERSCMEAEGSCMLPQWQGCSSCNVIWTYYLTSSFKAGTISVPAGRRSTDAFPQIEELHWNCPWKMLYVSCLDASCMILQPSCHCPTTNTHVFSCIINSQHYYFISFSLTW